MKEKEREREGTVFGGLHMYIRDEKERGAAAAAMFLCVCVF